MQILSFFTQKKSEYSYILLNPEKCFYEGDFQFLFV